jgi:zinc protease
VNRDVTGAALREILAEMRRVETERPSPQELGDFQRFLAGVLVGELSTSRGIIDQLRFLSVYGVGRDYMRTAIPAVHTVTPEDLVRVYSTYLRDDRRVIVLVGDTTLVRPQLMGWTRIIAQP